MPSLDKKMLTRFFEITDKKESLIKLAQIKEGDTIILFNVDCGKLAVKLVNEYSVSMHVVENNLIRWFLAKLMFNFWGVSNKVHVSFGDLEDVSIEESDIVIVDSSLEKKQQFRKYQESNLRSGMQLIFVDYQVPEWRIRNSCKDDQVYWYQVKVCRFGKLCMGHCHCRGD